MPRSVSPTLQQLLIASETHATADIRYSDGATVKRLSDTSFIVPGRGGYLPGLKSISEIKQSLFASIDRVSIEIANEDDAMGLDIADDARLLESAEVVVGRFYRAIRDAAIYEWRPLFVGRVAGADADERRAKIDVISDLTAVGLIGMRTLSPNCPLLYKGFWCGHTGSEARCNKQLKSPAGCKVPHRFGGWYSPALPSNAAPGASGNENGGDYPGDYPGDPRWRYQYDPQWMPTY